MPINKTGPNSLNNGPRYDNEGTEESEKKEIGKGMGRNIHTHSPTNSQMTSDYSELNAQTENDQQKRLIKPHESDKKKRIPPPVPPKPEKNHKSSKLKTETQRIDKNEIDIPFSEVRMKRFGKPSVMVRLLNTLPDQVLSELGWNQSDIDMLSKKNKRHAISDAAIQSLGINPSNVEERKEGRYFGAGGFGSAKFAQIPDPETGKPIICVAKKIKLYESGDETDEELKAEAENHLDKIIQELSMQQKAGSEVSPSIYGYSDTKDKYGAKTCIIFMSQAKGVNGQDLIKNKKLKAELSLEDKKDIAFNLASKIRVMHANGIYHKDLKPENCTIELKNKKVKILDYGCASSTQYSESNLPWAPCHWPPEMIIGKQIDNEKVDVYSLGIMMIDLLRADEKSNPFSEPEENSVAVWEPEHYHKISLIIKAKIKSIQFPSPEIKELVSSMIHPDPEKRPTMDEIINKLSNIKRTSTYG